MSIKSIDWSDTRPVLSLGDGTVLDRATLRQLRDALLNKYPNLGIAFSPGRLVIAYEGGQAAADAALAAPDVLIAEPTADG